MQCRGWLYLLLLGVLLEPACCGEARSANKKKRDKKKISVTGDDHRGIMVSIDNMLIDKKHKFLFCPIQKSGSSLWNQLFLRLQGDPHWWEPPWHKKLPIVRAAKLSSHELERIMNDDSWTKAVFFRDPSRRLLSAWKYCINKKNQINQYRNHMTKVTKSTNYSWSAFLDSVTSPLQHQNLHWRPQVDFWNLELSWLHGPALLRRLGIWEEYGAREWSLAKVINSPISPDSRPERYQLKHKPKNYNTTDCMFCGNYAPHQSKYADAKTFSRRLSANEDVSYFLNKPEPPHATKNKSELYLTEQAWTTIKQSNYYAKDYDVFSKIQAGPFEKGIYSTYPPPPNAMV